MDNKLEMLPLKKDIETKRILKQLSRTSRALAELKGIAQTIPNQNILINAIMINEAKTSSRIENIVTTHDEIYKAMIRTVDTTPAEKEVVDYRTAIWEGYNLVKEKQMINTNIIVKIQEKLEHNQAGIRNTLGTVIKNMETDEIVYTPPQEKEEMAEETISIINRITDEIVSMKHELRDKTKLYSKELLEALFFEFYTKIPYIQKQLGVSDKTAQKYLDYLVELGFLTSEKIGRERIYRNERLFNIIRDTDRD